MLPRMPEPGPPLMFTGSNAALTQLRKPRPGKDKGFDQVTQEVKASESPVLLSLSATCCSVVLKGREAGRGRSRS